MREWFLCKAKFMQEDDKGFTKLATKVYLLDAINYTDAEARIHTELQYNLNKEFQVTNISKTNINEVYLYEDGILWFKAKIQYTVIDGDTEKEKKITQYMVLPANDLREAYDRLEEQLGKLMAHSQIRAIQDTLIQDVFPYVQEQEEEGIYTGNDPNGHKDKNQEGEDEKDDSGFQDEVTDYEKLSPK